MRLDVDYPALVAAAAASTDELAVAAASCVACPDLVASRTQVVPGTFPSHADLLFVGEAPGAQEDVLGRPFVGKSGQLLDELLAEVGLDRRRIAVSNVVKCRPPANRKPRRAEVGRCRAWLSRQIELQNALLIVALGGTAAEWFFGPAARIATLREQAPHRYGGRTLIVTYHPSAAIRFGPQGAPLAALRTDLVEVARVVQQLRAEVRT
jgi:DNA polymerase